jgi:CheY-like chemotaxis protein
MMLTREASARTDAMARILSISYDDVLLRTRALLLESRGYEVTTAEGFAEALEHCRSNDDLVIICHSIPRADKRLLIAELRKRGCVAPVLSILRNVVTPIPEADFAVDADPEHVLDTIRRILAPSQNKRS